MEEFLADLRELDETQERVEAVSGGMMRAQRSGHMAQAREMVESWVQALRASDFQAERVAFLYVANHVLQKTLFGESEGNTAPLFVELFSQHLEEAVALVCNSPMDRQNVTRLLELWYEKKIFSDAHVLKMWRCTGEDIPGFLDDAAAADGEVNTKHSSISGNDVDMEELPNNHGAAGKLSHVLPMKLNSHSANPVLDVLKKIDHHKTAVKFLDQQIKQRHQFLLKNTAMRYQTAADLVADRGTASAQIKQRAEDCLKLVKVRNEQAATKIEQKLEQCDEIDLGLMDVTDHQKKFSEEWSSARFASRERRKQREEIQRLKDEEIARLHQEAIAESAMHAMNLEADINSNSKSELQSLSKEFKDRPQEKDAKTDNENELVWNPLK
ncbi:uncharacterized protein PITG_15806 [Phytophthora infestans T30-4]|uniref:CID domain-containing protein n=1 Tax=Phytophthora infestans (strain T30-4) TaxID=403677 RepID=D0NS63_PHYIT|nr:uncharacterized protein PITG_15806 [Phytophthora infestans T30-4]EEY63467.1 conserved hypothetical protein [Phytophthora infestans T30-4]|eukprot:XP_002898054.1 conserved hypothetical protein [Phytophthora infestans T30-4]